MLKILEDVVSYFFGGELAIALASDNHYLDTSLSAYARFFEFRMMDT